MYEPTVFLVDDDAAIRDSLRWLLESVSLRVETYESAEKFLKNYSIYRTGCLVVDIRMPGMSGLQLQQKLNEHPYSLPIIVITGHGDIPMAVQAMRHGALEFIEKPFNDQELLDRIQQGLEQDLINRDKRLRYDATRSRLANLTEREREVLNLIVSHSSNKAMASELGISIKTVEFHRARVMEKMHAESLIDLIEMVKDLDPRGTFNFLDSTKP
ncbi:MAG: response regulator transcription factor, partial [Thiotrichales bacterium]